MNSSIAFVSVLTSGRKIVQEYNLKQTQLAFAIGMNLNINEKFPTIIDHHMIVFFDGVVEDSEKEIIEDHTRKSVIT